LFGRNSSTSAANRKRDLDTTKSAVGTPSRSCSTGLSVW